MKNTNLVISKPTDYVEGVNSPIPFKGVTAGNWTTHIEFFERQLLAGSDSDGCEFFTAQESFDAQMDAYISSLQGGNQFIEQIIAMGFMDISTVDNQPHFHSSPRFLQVMSGVGQGGASMPQVWDTMRSYGCLPWKDLPTDPSLTVAEYFAPISEQSKAKAIQFLSLIGGKNAIGYKWILNNQPKNVALIAQKLPQAPICLGIAVDAGWNEVSPLDPPATNPPQHAVLCYKTDGVNLFIDDHYDPFLKVLDTGYPVLYALQGIVNPNYTPPPVPPTIPPPTANITTAQEQSILSQIAAWLRSLIPWLNNNPQIQ